MTRHKNTQRERVLRYYTDIHERGEEPPARRHVAVALGLTRAQVNAVVATFEPAEAAMCGIRKRPRSVIRRTTEPLPFGRPLPTLLAQERALEAMLAPLGRLPSGRRIRD